MHPVCNRSSGIPSGSLDDHAWMEVQIGDGSLEIAVMQPLIDGVHGRRWCGGEEEGGGRE